MNRLVEALHSGRVLVMDGAMGTELQRLGLRDDECSALWNITHPEQVAAVHAAYLEAGAEVLLTNTFLANPEQLSRYGWQDRLSEIWQAAIQNARIFTNPAPLLLADLTPNKDNRPRDRFRVAGLSQVVDGLLVETVTLAQLRGLATWSWYIQHDAPPLPFVMSIAFQRPQATSNLYLMARSAAEDVDDLMGAFALGANCGCDTDMDDLLDIIRVWRDYTDLPLVIRPNAGTPTRTANGYTYPRSPEYMADKLWPLLEAGVTMVGGCCGTTPAHIAAFRRVVDEWNAKR